jgi:hypothetical protein
MIFYRGFYLVVCRYFFLGGGCFIVGFFCFFLFFFNLTGNRMYRPLYIVFRFHWLVSVTGARGMPWQNCHGYLFLLLILLIVALIVAAQLLWQYFLPSRLVAALDHKWHLPPNTNTLPLMTQINYIINIWIYTGLENIFLFLVANPKIKLSFLNQIWLLLYLYKTSCICTFQRTYDVANQLPKRFCKR